MSNCTSLFVNSLLLPVSHPSCEQADATISTTNGLGPLRYGIEKQFHTLRFDLVLVNCCSCLFFSVCVQSYSKKHGRTYLPSLLGISHIGYLELANITNVSSSPHWPIVCKKSLPRIVALTKYNSKSVKFQGYQCIHLGRTSDNESLSPPLVQIKVTTVAMERQKQDNPQKGNGFAFGAHRKLISPYPSWLILLEFCVLLVSLLEAWGSTCSPIRLHRGSSSSRRTHPYVQSQEGLLCLPAQSQEHGGDTRRPAFTQGELDRAVEGHQPSSRTSICSFVRGGKGGALPEPHKMTSSRLLVSHKMTSSRLLVCTFLTKLSETDSMRVTGGPDDL